MPRFGNVVLLHDRVVVAAAKQFSPAENEARSVKSACRTSPTLPAAGAGLRRLRPGARSLDRREDADARARGFRPDIAVVAASLVAESDAIAWPSAERLAAWLDERARALLSATQGEPDGLGGVHVYRDADGTIVAAHVLPLAQHAALRTHWCPRCSTCSRRRGRRRCARSAATRPNAAAHRCWRASPSAPRATADELAAVTARLADVSARDRLRESGDALFTHLHEIPPGATSFVPPTNRALTIALDPELDVNANAQQYYARYRKAADALPHLEKRRDALAARSDALDALAFEAERADAPTLPELEAYLDELEGRAHQRVPADGRQTARAAAVGPAVRRAHLRRPLAARERRGDVQDRAAGRSVVPRARHPGLSTSCCKRRPAARRRTTTSPPQPISRRRTAKHATRRASRSTTPSASTSASSATRAPAWCGTPTPARASVAPDAEKRP